jgi:hypothetical protein
MTDPTDDTDDGVPTYDLELTTEELTEIVLGLDCLQRAGGHTAEVTFPLRNRVRAILFPPAEPETADAATEPAASEPDGQAPASEPAAPVGDSGANVELPSVSSAPPAPGLPGLEPVSPPSTDTGTPEPPMFPQES